MEPQLPPLMALGTLTYAPDHQYGTVPADHGVKLPRDLGGERLKAAFPQQEELKVNPEAT